MDWGFINTISIYFRVVEISHVELIVGDANKI